MDLITPGQEVGRKAAYSVDHELSQGETKHSAKGAKHSSFGEHLPNQRAAAGAQRCPHGKLLAASQAARQLKICDIRARDEQHQKQRARQRDKDRLYLPGHDFPIWNQVEMEVAGMLWILARNPPLNALDLRLGRLHGYAFTKRAEHVEKTGAAIEFIVG
jgi:hypothetical protein